MRRIQDASPPLDAPRALSFEHAIFAGERPRATPRSWGARVEPLPRRPRPAPPEAKLLEFVHWMCAQSGIHASSYRTSIFGRREGACLRALRASSVEAARTHLERHPEDIERALGTLLIGVTSFFRDAHVFLALQTQLATLARPRQGLRVLSVGCSDGSELYSVAILLAEAERLRGSALAGIDCRPAALDRARSGIYSSAALEGVDPERKSRWFQAWQGGLRVRPELAEACTFTVADALDPHLQLQEQHDVILCRNLAIYLQPDAAHALWSRLCAALRPGGLLVTGKAERPTTDEGLRSVAPSLFARRA